mgnify:CR=1 FL=1
MKLTYAPAWKRLIAFWADMVVMSVILTLLSLFFEIPPSMDGWLSFAVFMGYNVTAECYFAATLGKRLLGIQVVRHGGAAPTWRSAFYRNFGKFISALPLYWGFIRILTPSFPQAIHDEVARCFVVEKRGATNLDSHG